MTAKYTVLGNTTLATASASVTFSSIPGGYKDLVLVVEWVGALGLVSGRVRLNGDTGSNYQVCRMVGSGTNQTSFAGTRDYMGPEYNLATQTDSTFFKLEIMDYSATNKHKTGLARNGFAAIDYEGTVASVHRWANTAAVTSLQFDAGNANNLGVGSTFRLLGVN